MNILLVGSGGREHALAWKLKQSPKCRNLYCAPGNAGIAQCAQLVDLAVDDLDGLVDFARRNAIDLVVVGPEAPLVAGLADRLHEYGVAVFGPDQKAARLEGSKRFMKDLCASYNIPTASYGSFTDFEKAESFIRTQNFPLVVKADGLAAGKGVIIAENETDALQAAQDMLAGNAFGDAGHEIVVEEFLTGEEISYFALSDGESVVGLSSAQDHKRAYDGDLGPNTGGMGACSPARLMNDALERKIMQKIIVPTVQAMKAENCPFTGVLFAGLMVKDGEPRLLEFNARFGDPECQALMLRLESDLPDLLYRTATGGLKDVKLQWSPDPSICVVLAAKGYPGDCAKGSKITGLKQVTDTDGLVIFHAATATDGQGNFISTGGRVLGITAKSADLKAARDSAYEAIDRIGWEDGFCRSDIGWRALSTTS